MAGKRQHFVPQFLQRGFACAASGSEVFTWLHRKDSQPLKTNLKNAGVEGFFYSIEQCTELDEAITDFEGAFCHLVSDLRNGLSSPPDTLRIAQLLAHLEIRTRHLRQSFLETSTYLMDELMKFFSNEEACGEYFRRAMQRDPSIMREAMAKELQQHGISLDYLPNSIELSQPMLEQMISKLLPQVSMFAQQFRNSAPAKLKEAAKTGQIKAMQRTLAPTSKVERLARLDYEIVEFVGPPLVLGDSIVLFQVESERAFRPFLDGSDKLVAVYLPLSPRQVLVGANASMTLDSACLRREIARCSLEHFVASEAPPQHDDLVSLIGENANLLTVDQADAIMSELLTK